MAYFDVFNGDADGLCALVQLRQHTPLDSTLVTGVKRDISLLKCVQAQAGDVVTVLDVSWDKNHEAAQQLLDAGAHIRYFDHHRADKLMQHEKLQTNINTAANTCTSLIVNAHLDNAYTGWGIVGAFGDNLFDSACNLAKTGNYTAAQLGQLQELGTLINYNAYGESEADLYFAPTALFAKMRGFAKPLHFIAKQTDTVATLRQGYADDMHAAESTQAMLSTEHVAVFVLPDAAWARRVSGVWSNNLANAHPDRAHAVLTHKSDGTLQASVRAPLNNKQGADVFCSRYPSGGGRAAAAGINAIAPDDVEQVAKDFAVFYAQA